jgi:hypothetical protein
VVPGPAARILSPSPIATNGTTRATRREAGVTGFVCGAVGVPLRRCPPAGSCVLARQRSGSLRGTNRGTEGFGKPDTGRE